MKQSSIHQDQRLHQLDKERLERLTRFADTLSKAPQAQKMTVFLGIMQEMRTNHLTFSSEEQELLFSVLTEHMSEQEKQKAVMIRNLSARLAKQ